MIADCETCDRKQVPCKSCEESQRAICYRCGGDVDDPYCELLATEAKSPGPMPESGLSKKPHDFKRFNRLMGNLHEWRNADHDDYISVHRNQAIEIIEGVRAMRAALDEIAAMDPKGIRADDLGRAARIASAVGGSRE